jgi:hypothetical protein
MSRIHNTGRKKGKDERRGRGKGGGGDMWGWTKEGGGREIETPTDL